ncbi:MAG: hypothetical protein NVS9B13_19950 [Candidatus Acidiferrum sp.]
MLYYSNWKLWSKEKATPTRSGSLKKTEGAGLKPGVYKGLRLGRLGLRVLAGRILLVAA